MSNIYEKLLFIQTELKAPKSQYNSFGKYYYRNCEDIQESLKPLLKQMNTTLIISDEVVSFSGKNYIQATARFIDCEDGQEITNTALAREEDSKKGMDASQITGSTSSYARKYALNGLFCIDDSKDSDNDRRHEVKKTKEEQLKELIEEFESELTRTQKPLKWFLRDAKVDSVDKMEIDYLTGAIEALKTYPTKE